MVEKRCFALIGRIVAFFLMCKRVDFRAETFPPANGCEMPDCIFIFDQGAGKAAIDPVF